MYKRLVQDIDHRYKKAFVSQILKENVIFIVFSFFVCLMPIILCLYSSLIKPNGSQAVMAIGYIIPFTMAFMQISFTISMIIFAKLKEIKKVEDRNDYSRVISASIWMNLIIGFLMVITYILSCFLYMYFSNNRPNTQPLLWYGLNFLWTTIPFVFLFPLYISTIFIAKRRSESSALILLIVFFGFFFIFSLFFGVGLELNTIGFGIGITLALIVSLIINALYIKSFQYFHIYGPIISKDYNKIIFKFIFKESITSISLSLFKGLAIIFLSIWIPNSINGFVPLSYQMSRVIWFNMMYFIPFLGIGIGEGVRYHYLQKHGKYSAYNCYLEHRWKNDFKIIYLTVGITVLIAVGCIFLVKPLCHAYSKNDFNEFENGIMPTIEGWGIPSEPPLNHIDFSKFEGMQISPFPNVSFKPTNTGNISVDIKNKWHNAVELLKITNWVQENIQNNPNAVEGFRENLEILGNWIKWFNQVNVDGVSIAQFISNKYGFATDNPDYAGAIKNSLSYYIYLWLYSRTNPYATEAFVSLRQIVNYNNVIDQLMNILDRLNNENLRPGAISDLKTLMVNHSFDNIMLSIFLYVGNKFNAKAMIYIAIFGVCNSLWAILLQINQRNKKVGMPYWMMSLVYFLCIGFLVVFGALFGVVLKDKLGTSNPFQYLDAWTFPLIPISFAVISYLSIKSFVVYKHYQKEKERAKTDNVKVY